MANASPITSEPLPLMNFTDDEILFRDNIRQFADEKIRPRVKEMDEKGVFDAALIQEFFQIGLMGIEIPEEYGGEEASSSRRFLPSRNSLVWMLRPA